MPNSKQYPPQDGAYKVMVKHGDDWKKFQSVRLQISVGQLYHEGEKFLATCKWAAARFDGTHEVSIADTLQRYSLAAQYGISLEMATNKARDAGTAWLVRNKAALSLLPNLKISRWDEWLQHPDFAEAVKQVDDLYETSVEFRDAIDTAARNYAQRQSTHAGEFYSERMRDLSAAYLKEETAIFHLQALSSTAIDIYPGDFMKVWNKAREMDWPLAGLKNRRWARVDFASNKSEKPIESIVKNRGVETYAAPSTGTIHSQSI